MSEAAVQTPNWRIDSWFSDLDARILQNLKLFRDELSRENRTLNLVSAKTMPFVDAIHFSDSILASRLIYGHEPTMTEIFDLAGGSGFPGVVFALLFPKVNVVSVGITEKSADFLKSIAAQCQIANLEARPIALDKMPANSMKYCMARNVGSISRVILMMRKMVPVGGELFHMRGETWPAEVGEIPTQLCSAWMPALVGEYKLPVGPMKFSVVKTTRIGS